MDNLWQEFNSAGAFHLPESPRKPMEFLSRSWSDAALQTLHSPPSPLISKSRTAAVVTPETTGVFAVDAAEDSDVSPLASGRLSHSSGPLNPSHMEETDSLHISPSDEYEDVVKLLQTAALYLLFELLRLIKSCLSTAQFLAAGLLAAASVTCLEDNELWFYSFRLNRVVS
ncbi:hypothetical protein L1987_03828 [Smallanthus sonchifolius]|uniref:Uncharacterized protein n=1 Tax=Smallanthus sonchifolius TaxID=185202 RepID=A0ACB9KBZ6_9ASTR|nr:hypothetical protein L1987_03828 [Smallanthus sonchifolius]